MATRKYQQANRSDWHDSGVTSLFHRWLNVDQKEDSMPQFRYFTLISASGERALSCVPSPKVVK